MQAIVISGPSGVGKNTILEGLFAAMPHLRYGQSVTTRDARPNDVPGKYLYLGDEGFPRREKFMQYVSDERLLEWAAYGDHLYGTLEPAEGSDIVLEVDVQGAAKIKQNWGDARLITIIPPGNSLKERLEILRKRLVDRGTDDITVIERRMQEATRELTDGVTQADLVVINDDIDQAVAEIVAFIKFAPETDRGVG